MMQAHQKFLVNAVAGYEGASEHGFSSYLTDLARHHRSGRCTQRMKDVAITECLLQVYERYQGFNFRERGLIALAARLRNSTKK